MYLLKPNLQQKSLSRVNMFESFIFCCLCKKTSIPYFYLLPTYYIACKTPEDFQLRFYSAIIRKGGLVVGCLCAILAGAPRLIDESFGFIIWLLWVTGLKEKPHSFQFPYFTHSVYPWKFGRSSRKKRKSRSCFIQFFFSFFFLQCMFYIKWSILHIFHFLFWMNLEGDGYFIMEFI